MKILMVSSYLPYPLFNGGNVRLYNILKRLGKDHDVTLICEKRNYQTEKDIDELRKFCKKVITVERKKQWSFGNILKAAFSQNPFLVVGHTNENMKNKIRGELAKEKFDLIHVETFYVLQNVPKTHVPIVLVEHNVEYLVYQRYANQAPFLLKPLMHFDVLKLKVKEKQSWKKVRKLIAVSEREKNLMQGKYVEVVPNGVDINFYLPSKKSQDGKRVLFIGDFKWIENLTSAEWILKDIWPLVKKENVKLWIVGRKIPENIKKLGSSNVIFEENAEEANYVYKNSHILLAPIKVGGGTSFKILEAMASGIPVITTPLGAEGISSKNNEIIVAKSSKEIADKISELLENKDLYDRVSKNARRLVVEKFNWDRIVENLNKVYKESL